MALNIANLNGDNGFITVGTGPDGRDVHGISISGLGDVNGDGLDDFVIGSDGGDFSPPDLAGRSHVIFGTTNGFPEFIDLTKLDSFTGDEDIGFTIFGPQPWSQAGFAVGSAGDMNGDGFMDIVIGGPNDDVRFYGIEVEVEVPVIDDGDDDEDEDDEDGGDDEPQTEIVTVELNDDLRKAEGAAWVVYGQASFEDAVFLSNGDGAVVRKFDGDVPTPVDVVQYNLLPGALDDGEVTQDDFYFDPKGLFYGEQVGYSVGTQGDVNGDGADDLIVGSKGDLFTTGDTFVIFGKVGDYIDSLSGSDINGTNGIQISGLFGNDQAGSATTLVDLNGDGVDDIVIGANEFDNSGGNTNEGRVYVVFGSTDPGYYTQNGGRFTVADIGGRLDGIVITGKQGTLAGEAINNAGDVNGDGIDDLLIASPGSNGFHQPGSPSYNPPDSYIIWGKNDGGLRDINLGNLSPADGVRITKGNDFSDGGNIVDFSHEYADTAGDVNSDGFDDIILGTNQKNTGAGFATVIYGSADFGGSQGLVIMDDEIQGTGGFRVFTTDQKPFNTLNFNGTNTNFGASVGGIGDINGDGVDDVAIGQPAFTGEIDGTPVTEDAISDTLRERGKTSIVFGVKFEDLGQEITSGFNDKQQEVITLTISLSNPALNRVTVNWQTVNGTAVAGSDFVNAGGALTFEEGQQTKTIDVTILGNDFTEGDESFGIEFTDAKGAGFSLTDDNGNYLGGSTTDTMNVTIQSLPNEAPVANNDSASVQEDTIATGTVRGNDSDADGDPLSFSLNTGPSNGIATVNPDGSFTYDPSQNFNGVDSFTYTVDDGKGATDTGTVTITVAPVNDAPEAQDDRFFIDEDTSVNGSVLANNGQGADTDPEGDPVTVTLTSNVQNGQLTLNANGTFSYEPDANFNGTDTFTYTVSDAPGSANSATVTIEVDPVQDDPIAANDVFTLAEGTLLLGNVMADNGAGPDIELDNEDITVSLREVASNGSAVVLSGGAFIYIPNDGFSGTDLFTYELRDEDGNTDTATVLVTVEARLMTFDVTASAPQIDEGDQGTQTLTFTVTRTGNTADVGRVDFAITGLGADPLGSDDVSGPLPSGTLTFGVGETQQTVSIEVTGDFVPEANETVGLTLSNADNAGDGGTAFTTQTAAVVVLDGDQADLVGTNGKDKLRGDDDDEVIVAGGGDDRVDGRDGDDVLIGEDGDDRLRGRDDDDLLIGGAGNDRLDGGNGDDILRGGPGDEDRLKGGKDDDIFVYELGDGTVIVEDFDEDDDLIDLSGLGADFDTLDEIMAVADQEKKDVIFEFGGGNDLVIRKIDVDDLDDADLFIL